MIVDIFFRVSDSRNTAIFNTILVIRSISFWCIHNIFIRKIPLTLNFQFRSGVMPYQSLVHLGSGVRREDVII